VPHSFHGLQTDKAAPGPVFSPPPSFPYPFFFFFFARPGAKPGVRDPLFSPPFFSQKNRGKSLSRRAPFSPPPFQTLLPLPFSPLLRAGSLHGTEVTSFQSQHFAMAYVEFQTPLLFGITSSLFFFFFPWKKEPWAP